MARWQLQEAATGLTVASGDAPTVEQASAEAAHYAIQYAQDGPVKWWVKDGRKIVFRGSIAGVTITRVTTDARQTMRAHD